MIFFELKTEDETRLYKSELDKYGKLIRSAVNFAWHAWERTQITSYEEQAHYPAVAAAMVRHICEQIAAVGVLTASGSAEPCKLHLRSAFEALLGIEYILETDSERRGIAYQVAHARRRIAFYQRLDPGHETGKQLHSELKSDPLASGLSWQTDTKPMVANLEALLAKPEFVPIAAEWQRIRGTGRNRRKVEWFALFGGPKDVEHLAKRLKRAVMYEFLYREWSNAVHAGDCLLSFAQKIGGKPLETAIKPIQHPDGLAGVIFLSLSICHAIARLLLERWGKDDLRQAANEDWKERFSPMIDRLRADGLPKVSSWR